VTLKTEYEFTLPRGYVDAGGSVHRRGVMRLATARDELEPLRHPTISGPDDPRLTVLILARVVTKLGDVPMITANEIEGLFAVDLAFLQDFYGVINFGTQEEYEALLAAQAADSGAAAQAEADEVAVVDATADSGEEAQPQDEPPVPRTRARVVEVPRSKA
jgi:hypothetical protein